MERGNWKTLMMAGLVAGNLIWYASADSVLALGGAAFIFMLWLDLRLE